MNSDGEVETERESRSRENQANLEYDANYNSRQRYIKAAAGPDQPGVSKPENDTAGYAKGGEVHFCSACVPHEKGCEYFADGGEAELEQPPEVPAPTMITPDNPNETLGHVAAIHGLLGLLGGKVGHEKPQFEKEKHDRILEHAKEAHVTRTLPIESESGSDSKKSKLSSVGSKLGDHLFEGNHENAAELLHQTPLVGSVGKKNLAPILQKLSGPMMQKEPNSAALRSSVDYLNTSIKGASSLDEATKGLFNPSKKVIHERDKDAIEPLKEKLDEIEQNPAQLLDVGGDLGHYLPEHSGALAYTLANASNYLKSLKPTQAKNSPLDEQAPIDKFANQKYERQLDIAQRPLLVLQHAKDGTLQTQDMQTLQTIYPELHKAIVDKVGTEMIEAKAKNTEIPYKQRLGIAMILGQPLDSTMTPASMMSIIGSCKNNAPETQKNAKPTAAALKAANQANKMIATPLEQREIDRKS